MYKCFSMTIEYCNYVRVISGLVERIHGGVRCYVIHFFSVFFFLLVFLLLGHHTNMWTGVSIECRRVPDPRLDENCENNNGFPK